MRGRVALFCALATVPLVAGCESGTEGAATLSSVAPEALFDSCTLPASALQAAGLDPSTVDNNPFGVPRTGWRGCQWQAQDFAVRVFATTRTVAEYRANPTLRDFRGVALEGREAFSFVEGKTEPPDNCSVAFSTSRGTIDIFLTKDITLDRNEDWCAAALRVALQLNSHIPQ